MKLSEQVEQVILACPMPVVDMGNRAQLAAMLRFNYGLMLASENLLKLAMDKADGDLCAYYERHLAEEREHAQWLANDIRTLGYEPKEIDHATATIAGAQYYYLHHIGPEILLGYMAALEFRPMPVEVVEMLAHLYEDGGLGTLLYHAKHDVEHAQELRKVIDAQTMRDKEIVYNAFATAKMVVHYMNERIMLAREESGNAAIQP